MGSSSGSHRRQMPTTRWSLVARAGQEGEDQRKALAELLARYTPAMMAHLKAVRGVPIDVADDLLQGFIADKILEKELIARADRGRGKFRWFLLTSLNRYVFNTLRDANAKKRAPDNLGPLDEEKMGAHSSDPFDEAWAKGVLAEALQRMRAECEAAERMDIWGVFQCRIVRPILEGAKPLAYEHVVARFGFQSPIQASNALITAKRMYARMLRSAVGEYVDDEAEIEEEIAVLREILSRSGAES